MILKIMKWRFIIKDYLIKIIHKINSLVYFNNEYLVKRPLGMIWILKIQENCLYRERLVSRFLFKENV